MKTVFADTLYWVALINPKDQWHARVLAVAGALTRARLLTTDEVLVETLNFYAGHGSHARRTATSNVRAILRNANIEVVPQNRDRFLAGLALYETRQDKRYSLTDCISMLVCRDHGVSEVLTHDDHFRQGVQLTALRPAPLGALEFEPGLESAVSSPRAGHDEKVAGPRGLKGAAVKVRDSSCLQTKHPFKCKTLSRAGKSRRRRSAPTINFF